MGAFPREAAIIGQLVIGYGELELALMNSVQTGRGGDLDTVLKAMFRARGESRRIEVADALGRQVFIGLGLGQEFNTAIADMNYCRRIRNQYAHCQWVNDGNGFLGFVNLEEIAKLNTLIRDMSTLTHRHIDVPLLQEQEKFLDDVEHEIAWLNFEARVKLGTGSQLLQAPVPLQRPLLYKP
jgi:hypothetical protein